MYKEIALINFLIQLFYFELYFKTDLNELKGWIMYG